MVVDFDVLQFCRKLKKLQEAPYKCPIEKCTKIYLGVLGLQYHLLHFDHDNMDENSLNNMRSSTSKLGDGLRMKKKRRKKRRALLFSRTPNTPQKTPLAKEADAPKTIVYNEQEEYVEMEVDGKVCRININDELPMISKKDYEASNPNFAALNSITDLTVQKQKEILAKLPKPSFTIISDYKIEKAPPLPVGYIRYIEKNPDEYEHEVEYDMDEEDFIWVEKMNEDRQKSGLSEVSSSTFMLLMDRFEKESYFQMQTSNKGSDVPAMIDDDAICCICLDGECQNSNVILFCDLCNLAVHQDCYGVPYIPEGPWVCRKCLHSPSAPVDCVLCPNNTGAFKQTDRGHWAHIVCALWIPEVRFSNTVFLEPIDSIETISAARWKLTCYICKQKGSGACIQCHKGTCYAAFHVTCAQHAGLYMKIDAIETSEEFGGIKIQKIAYCDSHTPSDAEKRPKLPMCNNKKNFVKTSAPIISVPTIPPEKIQEIASLINIQNKKNHYIQRAIAYWILKRRFRNGVPLLRRFQPSQGNRGTSTSNKMLSWDELRKQLKYWQCLRQDLERSRLLCELVRKRERLKRELVKLKAQCLELELCPFNYFLKKLVDLLRDRDTGEIFIEPVDLTEVVDYCNIVKNPMDLSTMRKKIDLFEYNSLGEFQSDFNLMINNCLAYNAKDTVYYRAAIKMREQGGALLREAQKDLEILKIDYGSSTSTESIQNDSYMKANIDIKLESLSKAENSLDVAERITRLEKLVEECNKLKSGAAKVTRIKSIKKITATLKRKLNKKLVEEDSKEDDDEKNDDSSDVKEPPAKRSKRSSVIKKELNVENVKLRVRNKEKENLDSVSNKADGCPDFKTYRTSGFSSDDEVCNVDGCDGACQSCPGCLTDGSTCNCNSETCSQCSKSEDVQSLINESIQEDIEYLQFVWAKCRGFPWYPALTINPKMPPDYKHNGVPIPAPPDDILQMSTIHKDPVCLVLFFDAKRTWQWLPRNKLEPLGLSDAQDKSKLKESKKPAERKAVKKGYELALAFRNQLAGSEPEESK